MNNVKFDGIRKAFLIKAKSGLLNFVNPDGTFKSFIKQESLDAWINQARRQVEAANDFQLNGISNMKT